MVQKFKERLVNRLWSINLFYVILAVILCYGCQKEFFKENDSPTEEKELKSFFYENDYDQKLIQSLKGDTLLILEAEWGKIEERNKDSLKYLFVPLKPVLKLKSTGKVVDKEVNLVGYKKYIIAKMKDKGFNVSAATYVADSLLQNNNITVDFNNFSGRLIINDFEYNKNYVVFYKNGYRVNPAATAKSVTVKSTGESNVSPGVTVSWFDYQCQTYYECQWGANCGENIYFTYTSGLSCGFPTAMLPCFTAYWSQVASTSYPVCNVIEYPDPPMPGAPQLPALPAVNIDQIMPNLKSLPPNIQQAFRVGFDSLLRRCITSGILRTFQANNSTIDFEALPANTETQMQASWYVKNTCSRDANGNWRNNNLCCNLVPVLKYNPNYPDQIHESSLFEEVIHAWQIDNTFWSNRNSLSAYNSNYEFEAKLLRDLSNYIGLYGGIQSNMGAEYSLWLEDITQNGTKYPTSFEDLQGKYFHFMEIWKAANPYYTKPLNMDLGPTNMFNIINQSACKK